MPPHYIVHEIHTGMFPVCSVLIHGQRHQLLWDTLSHPRHLSAIRPALHKSCLVAYSHADWDHVQGTAALDCAVVVGHRECARRFECEAPRTLRDLQAREPGMWDGVHLVPPTVIFDGQLGLDLGGCTVHLRHLPGHTPDSIVAFIPELALLLAGDAVELPCPDVPENCHLDGWIHGLEYWESHDGVRHVIPSHGPVGGREILSRTAAYLRALRDRAPLDLPRDASEFYMRTHAENLRHCGLAPGSRP